MLGSQHHGHPPAWLLGLDRCTETAVGMASRIETSIETIINTFHQYSTRLKHPDTLNYAEFKDLIKKELPNFLKQKNRDEAALKDIMEDLDTNADKQLSFEEFTMLVAKLVVASHEEMHKHTPKGPGHSHGPGLGEGRPGHGRGHCH
ncbi:protein S100-A9 [Sorex fumeus]|uniref:protein S100-A9 n=1 Tax=Sorex fumeus TaxID=62283 RepID=UPI0024AE21F5|nr:protein S100-A9 [Sorex fumeus]